MTPEIKQRIQQIRQGKTPKGYKKTKEGMIPEKWDVYQLSQVMGELESGTSVNSDVSNDTGLYVLKTSSIHDGIVDVQEAKPVIKSDFERLKCSLQKGCILISRMNTPELVGACGYSKKSSSKHYLPDRLWQAYNTSDNICDFLCLNYLLNTERYQTIIKSLATGTSNSMKNISKEMFLNITIPLPTLLEQTAIAEILSTQDRVIELKEQLLAEKKRQKKYLMQQLLTGKKRLKGFRGEWRKCRLGEVCDIRTGKLNANAMDVDGKYPFFTCDEKPYRINEYAFDTSAILVSGNGNVGHVQIYEGKFNAYQRTYVLDGFNQNLKLYLYQYMLYRLRKYLIFNLRGSSVPYITLPILSSFEIPIPPLPEQTAIAEILSTADREIELLGQSIEAEKQKKKSLMQLLLTGIVRVDGV